LDHGDAADRAGEMAGRESLLRAATRAPRHRTSGRRGVQAVPGRTRAAQGGGVRLTLDVVPANAGTHNPRRGWFKEVVAHRARSDSPRRMGPRVRFAGTTPGIVHHSKRTLA